MSNASKLRVYIAMSGGVDSSVAAALLKKQGFGVVGVFMKPWSAPVGRTCLWKGDREDAMRVAAKLGIPLKTWDFSKEYKKAVTDYMIREYKAGRTPNPDVMCNKEIKFKLFLNKALKEGADYIATGHYVIRKGLRLFQANDKNKDQSYFLWTLTPKQIQKCLFPIGDYTKPEVRKLAKKFGLANANKKDSQGICFIGPLDMKTFLKSQIKPKPGKIVSGNKVIGTHDGIFYYTIGQRHGLDLKIGKGPYYVVNKDVKKNIIYVGPEKDLFSKKAKIVNINLVDKNIKFPLSVDVKARYRAKSIKSVLLKNGELEFKKPERAVTSGQSAVFYRGQEMLGGGVIR